MLESNLPAGALYDDNAPWLYDSSREVKCEHCDGDGYIYHAFDLSEGEDTVCTETAWNIIPDDEDAAIARGERFFKGDKCLCPVCNGVGYIYV